MMELHPPSDTNQGTTANTPADAKSAVTSSVSPWLGPLTYFLGRNFLLPLFFGQIRIIGHEHIPVTGPVILAPTHRARWDALLVPYAVSYCSSGRYLRFMVTSSECKGLQGWFIKRLGGFAVDPKRPSIATLRHAIDLLLNGKMLVIFPEGGICKGKLHPLKPGISRLALTAESNHPGLGVKIVPISIDYSQPYPSWGTDVSIHIGKPINVVDYLSGCLKQDAKHLMVDISNALQELNHPESEINTHAFAEVSNL
jgi:1-acyl-sn-glycerol-3-phosphate acyltransferase